eukprot:COSAG02_NODE_4928_length_4823_cov_19.146486_2_plen_111_part_00
MRLLQTHHVSAALARQKWHLYWRIQSDNLLQRGGHLCRFATKQEIFKLLHLAHAFDLFQLTLGFPHDLIRACRSVGSYSSSSIEAEESAVVDWGRHGKSHGEQRLTPCNP